MFDDDFRSVGEIVQTILGGLSCTLVTDGNIVDLAAYRASKQKAVPVISEVEAEIDGHAADPSLEGGSARVMPFTNMTRCAGMFGQRS